MQPEPPFQVVAGEVDNCEIGDIQECGTTVYFTSMSFELSPVHTTDHLASFTRDCTSSYLKMVVCWKAMVSVGFTEEKYLRRY